MLGGTTIVVCTNVAGRAKNRVPSSLPEHGFCIRREDTMKPNLLSALCLCVFMAGHGLSAQHSDTSGHDTPYSGFESRDIKSLSAEDIAELEQGGGWGLALPAELNGRPGPAHLLELKDELELTAEQVVAIQAIYDEMRSEAIQAGTRFIAAEAALSAAFEDDGLDDASLQEFIEAAASARAELRLVHLSRHLATPALLTEHQIAQYNILRGYADDPCQSVPDGHDPTMWRKHNGCS